MNTIFKAIEFATQAHAGQIRKITGFPYIIHPLNVGNLLMQNKASQDIIVSGILHDTIEDTVITYENLKDTFNQHIADLVLSVTEGDKSLDWTTRKMNSLTKYKSATEDTLLILSADKIDNLNSIASELVHFGPSIWESFTKPKSDQKWYYQELLNIFKSHHFPYPHLIQEMERLSQLIFE